MTETALRACALAALVCASAACGPPDPRQVLVELNVPYTTAAWLAHAESGDLTAVTAFLAAGMDPDGRDAGGNTALVYAAAGGHVEVARLLLASRAQVNVTSGRGMTPLAAAILNDHPDLVSLLLDGGAETTAPTVDRTPLLLAIRARRPKVVQQLLDTGAPAYVQDHQWSALMMASFIGDADTVGALLSKDANLNAANDEGVTALMYAASAGHTAVVRALLAKGAAIDAEDGAGLTALMLAANNGHADTTQALLQSGPDADVRSDTGATARSLASANGHTAIAALLEGRPVRTVGTTAK